MTNNNDNNIQTLTHTHTPTASPTALKEKSNQRLNNIMWEKMKKTMQKKNSKTIVGAPKDRLGEGEFIEMRAIAAQLKRKAEKGGRNCKRKTKIAFRYIAYFGQITLHPSGWRIHILCIFRVLFMALCEYCRAFRPT